jgi:hypothetical protein
MRYLRHSGAGFGKSHQPFDGCEYLMDITSGGIRLVEGNIVRDGL